MRASVLVCAVLLGCGSPADPTDGGADGAVPSRVRIVASEGGEVRSPDGVFTLTIPPNAIAEDTDFAITIVPRDQWPAEASTLAPLGEVYDIQPDGVTFLVPALGVHALATTPSVLREDGNYAAVEHVMRSETALEPSPSTDIEYALDGSLRVEAEIPHTSEHWVTKDITRRDGPCSASAICAAGGTCMLGRCVRPLNAAVRVVGEAGIHEIGESWGPSSIELYVSADLPLQSLRSYSALYGLSLAVEHVVPEDWSTTPVSARSPPSDVDLQVGVAAPLPLPMWRCIAFGSVSLELGASFTDPSTSDLWSRNSVSVHLGDAICVEASTPAASLHDHLIVGSTCRVGPGSTSCDPATSGSTVSIQALSAEERARCTELAPGTELCEGVTGESEPGPDIAITTGLAEINARFDATLRRYVPDLFPSADAYGASDTMHLEATPNGASTPTTIDVAAPQPIESAEDILSEIEGVSSVVAPRTGETLDRLVIAELSGAGEPARLYRRLPGDASAPILDPATIAALSIRELTVERVLVGPIVEATDTTLFGTPILVAAGRFIEANPIDLFPTTTSPVHDCSSLPADLDALAGHPGENAVLCIGADGSCFVTNDLRIDTPLLPSQCPSSDRALIILIGAGATTANAGGEWLLPWASYGTDVLARGSSPPELTDVSTIVQRSDGARWRIDYRVVDGDTVHVESVTPVTIVPPYGESFDGLDTPRTFTSSYGVGTAQVFVRACWEPSGMFLHGNTTTTPEVERCRDSYYDYALALIVNGAGEAALDADHPATADHWQPTSTSHGTMSTHGVTGLPTGVDITTRIDSIPAGIPLEIVYRYTGSGFTVLSITEL